MSSSRTEINREAGEVKGAKVGEAGNRGEGQREREAVRAGERERVSETRGQVL